MTEQITRPQSGLEIATTGDGRDITRPYTTGMLVPADSILERRGGGDLLIYEQVLSDPQVKACFEQRRNAVTSCEWRVDAASDRPIDRKAAEWAEQQLNSVGFDNLTDKMLYGVFYGYSVAELLWERQGDLLGWSAIKVRNRRRFRFNQQGELRLITPQQPLYGEPAPKPYFWHIATGADHDDEPYGIGLGHWCYWPVLFKRNGIAFWLTFLEKFGQPTAVGKFPTGATAPERAKLLQAVEAIRTQTGLILPEGMAIDLLEAARSGSADYKVHHDTMDETIAKATLGQTMTTEDGSSKAQAEVHMDVRQDIVKGDSDLICESVNLGPLSWLTMLNFPGAEPPRVYRIIEEPEDASVLIDRDLKVMELGFVPSDTYVRETYGDHWQMRPVDGGLVSALGRLAVAADGAQDPRAADAALRAASGGSTPDDPAEFADDGEVMAAERAAAQERLDAILAGAGERGTHWRGFVEPMVQRLQAELDEAEDLAEFRERLDALADSQPNPEFVTGIARATFGGWLLGRTRKPRS